MRKNKSGQFLVTALIFMGLVIMLSGCGQSKTKTVTQETSGIDPFNFYSKVELDQTKDEVASELGGAAEETSGAYTYVDAETGYGVTVSYGADNLVALKSLYMPVDNDFASYSNASVTEDQAASITEGMTYDEAKKILGDGGLEIVCGANPEEKDKPIYAIAWINDDATSINLTLVGFEGIVYDATYNSN
ncbi:hypothetical protein [Acetobacterium bakii]|uniref:Uncharacterized protein n=1 Tax=Acetobacterium bakii TaxID=52689 RepID=A0A0L6TVW7_9FIRM|nr:hypothetical protein [Acetobacterium bakii]KNZ40404.1 hypothetical protein AKG39_17730 [Acetobacterium bakii]